MSAAPKESCRPAEEKSGAKVQGGEAQPYLKVPPGKGGSDKKWFDDLQRREISPVGCQRICWPKDPNRRPQVFRDWHAVAMKRIDASKAGNDAIGQFWRFVNLGDDVGRLWPSDDLLADCAVVSAKTISRQIRNYTALGIITTTRKWMGGTTGERRQSRVIDLTFPGDLSKEDFKGRAFRPGAWREYLRSKYPDTTGPNSEDEYPDHSGPKYPDTTGPGNVEGNVEGGASGPVAQSTSSKVGDTGGGTLDASASSFASQYDSSRYHASEQEEMDAICREFSRLGQEIDPRDGAAVGKLDDWLAKVTEAAREKWLALEDTPF